MTDMLKQVAAIITALGVIGGAAWAIGEDSGYRPVLKREFVGFMNKEFQLAMDQAQQNTLAIVKNKFDYLQDKLKYGELSFDEKESRCKSAQILEYQTVDGCTQKTGEPDFIITPVK